MAERGSIPEDCEMNEKWEEVLELDRRRIYVDFKYC